MICNRVMLCVGTLNQSDTGNPRNLCTGNSFKFPKQPITDQKTEMHKAKSLSFPPKWVAPRLVALHSLSPCPSPESQLFPEKSAYFHLLLTDHKDSALSSEIFGEFYLNVLCSLFTNTKQREETPFQTGESLQRGAGMRVQSWEASALPGCVSQPGHPEAG